MGLVGQETWVLMFNNVKWGVFLRKAWGDNISTPRTGTPKRKPCYVSGMAMFPLIKAGTQKQKPCHMLQAGSDDCVPKAGTQLRTPCRAWGNGNVSAPKAVTQNLKVCRVSGNGDVSVPKNRHATAKTVLWLGGCHCKSENHPMFRENGDVSAPEAATTDVQERCHPGNGDVSAPQKLACKSKHVRKACVMFIGKWGSFRAKSYEKIVFGLRVCVPRTGTQERKPCYASGTAMFPRRKPGTQERTPRYAWGNGDVSAPRAGRQERKPCYASGSGDVSVPMFGKQKRKPCYSQWRVFRAKSRHAQAKNVALFRGIGDVSAPKNRQ